MIFTILFSVNSEKMKKMMVMIVFIDDDEYNDDDINSIFSSISFAFFLNDSQAFSP